MKHAFRVMPGLVAAALALTISFASPTHAAGPSQNVTPESYCTILGQHCWYVIMSDGDAPNRIAYLADLKDRGWRVNDGIEDPRSAVRKVRVIEVFENMSGTSPAYNVYQIENECLKTQVRVVSTEHFWPDNRISREAGNSSWGKPSALWIGRAAIFSCVRAIQGHLQEAGVIHAVDIYRPADVATIIRSSFWKDAASPLNNPPVGTSGQAESADTPQ